MRSTLLFSALLAFSSVAAAAPPNVVLLSVDTLRADHLGCYGYKLDTSPHIDRFAKEALLFEDCVCEVPLTNPSFGAMLSSRYPRSTGTVRNGLKMPADVPLITEAFRTAGYQTACVQSNWTLRAGLSRLDRGFDLYRDDFETKRWGVMKGERYADKVTEVALEIIEDRDQDRPFFYWIHYSDPHAPYRFHKKFNPAGRKLWRVTGHDRVTVKYDSEIAFTDHHIGRLLDALPRENTVILFVADHGESLYEHNYLGHGRRIYQTNQHVPLIIRGPGIAPGRTPAPACILDVGPTLLALAGLTPAPGMLGVDLLNGSVPNGRARHIETYGGAVPKLPGAKALMADRPPMRRGVIQEGWKLILGGDGPELFHLSNDPLEGDNVADSHPDRVTRFTTLINTWDQAHPRSATIDAADLTKDDLQALEALGYLE
ncbi:MAG: sulfatase-like hydrolase/transferase [Nitrospiraceae bacterium]|nr:sulfatase-like hydrolase/transferase [Nitrospiraceae bacterium]